MGNGNDEISEEEHFENLSINIHLFIPTSVHLLSIYLNSRDPAPLKNFTREKDMKPPREWPWRRERGGGKEI